MKILVTGGCGNTGSALVKFLVDADHHVDIVDDLSSGSLDNLKREDLSCRPVLPGLFSHLRKSKSLAKDDIIVITADFTDDAVIRHIMMEKYDLIFHLAANTDDRFCNEFIAESTDTNLFKTIALAHAAAKSYVKKFVFASTSAYVDDSKKPASFAEAQKLSCEIFLEQFYNECKLDSVSVRMSENHQANAQAMLAYSKSDKKGALVYNVELGTEKQM